MFYVNPLIAFSSFKVKELLKSLDPDKSMGPDGFHPHLLKECCKTVCTPISLLFIKSFVSGKLPAIWKKANITPIFKKGARTLPQNYRPVSLLSVISKLFEKLIRSEMSSHLTAQKLISKDQHGFIERKSCMTNLIETLDIVSEALSRRFSAAVVFLDFLKAFDKVPHSLLLIKLEAYGFRGNLLRWLTCFLTGRMQRVVCGDSESDWTSVLSGALQGSVLGPLLFLVYINDMPELAKHFCKLFADDTKLISINKNSTDQETLQEDVDNLVNWSKTWQMELNEEKCKVMDIGRSKLSRTVINMKSTSGVRVELEETNSERDLGVVINNKLKWDEQVIQATLKANSALGILKRTFVHWNARLLVKLYTTYVRPNLEYCSSVWNPYRKKDIKKIEQVQRRATKLVPELRHLNYESRLANLGLTTLEVRRERGDLIQFFKILKGHNNVSWHCGIQSATSLKLSGPCNGIRGERHRVTPQLTKCDKRKMFFSNRVAASWNKLPEGIVAANTVNQFKNLFDSYMATR